MTAPFTASNGYTVHASTKREKVLAVFTESSVYEADNIGHEALRALVEYAASIGITAKPEGYVSPPKPPAPVKNSGIGNIYRGAK